ncbi:MAG: hypothetical protein ACREP2_06955 [Rhodanobacteraceae bacterium]
MFAGAACANPVTMNFDGIGTFDQVSTYYDGGCSTFVGPDTCNGPNYGVVWSGAEISDNTSGASGTIVPPSSPNYIILTNNSGSYNSATMNVAAGFGGSGFSFYYAGSGMVSVYSGLNGTGTLLNPGSEALSTSFCSGTGFCSSPYMLDFTGTAMSVVFTGNGIFDNVSFDMTPKAVPEPAAAGIFGFGVLLIGMFVGLRRRMA